MCLLLLLPVDETPSPPAWAIHVSPNSCPCSYSRLSPEFSFQKPNIFLNPNHDCAPPLPEIPQKRPSNRLSHKGQIHEIWLLPSSLFSSLVTICESWGAWFFLNPRALVHHFPRIEVTPTQDTLSRHTHAHMSIKHTHINTKKIF